MVCQYGGLKEMNNLDSDNLKPGMEIIIPQTLRPLIIIIFLACSTESIKLDSTDATLVKSLLFQMLALQIMSK